MSEEIYENSDSEITLKSIILFIKKAFWRSVLYILAAVILISVTALPIKIFWKTNPAVSLRAEFTYPGIENGLDPNGNIFNSDELRSPDVIAKAIVESDLDGKLTDVSKVRDSVIIEKVMDVQYYDLVARAQQGDADAQRELAEYSFFPNNFNIVLSEPSKLDLSKNEAIRLTENIFKQYQQYFKEIYIPEIIFNESAFSKTYTYFDYIDYYDIFVGELNSMDAFLMEIAKFNSTFRATSTQLRFGDLLINLSSIMRNIEYFKSRILNENAWLSYDKTLNSLKDRRNTLTIQMAQYDYLITETGKQIDKYEIDMIPAGGTGETSAVVIIPSYPAQYHQLQAKLSSYIDYHADLTAQFTETKERIDIMEKAGPSSLTPGLKQQMDDQLKDLADQSIEFTDLLNKTVEEYYQKRFLSDSIKIVIPAAYIRSDNNLPILWIYIIGAVVALVAALIVTAVKGKLNIKFIQKKGLDKNQDNNNQSNS